MPEIQRLISNYTPGELTYHEAVEGGELTAQEMLNLRADTNGALRLRHGIFARGTEQQNDITGIAASDERLYYITTNGQLFYRNNDRSNQSDTEIPIRTETGSPSNLNGRISLIYEYEDFDILTSEGEDQAYWIDIRETDNIQAYNLGINPPVSGSLTAQPGVFGQIADNERAMGYAVPEDQDPQGQRRYQFHYKMTYVRRHDKGVLLSRLEEVPPFYGMESQPGDPVSVLLSREQNAVTLEITHSIDPQVTGAIIYRRAEFIGTSEFRQIQTDSFGRAEAYYIPKSQERVIDVTLREDISDGEVLSENNERMPATVKAFALYRDLIFAPNTTELRYSDVRFDGLALYAFPEENSINQPVRCVFAEAYRELLLFGGRDGLWRLTGGTEHEFVIDQVSNLGPVDAYAVTKTEDVFAYVAPNGIFMSDGVATQSISDPLDAHFENREPIRASCIFLPNGNSMFSIIFTELDNSLTRLTFFRARQWQQWKGLTPEQATRFIEKEITGDPANKVLICERTSTTREILWENITQTHDGTTLTERQDIAWSWRSQRYDFAQEGLAQERKRFTKLVILGKIDGNITVTFTIYDDQNNKRELVITREATRENLYEVQIPIRDIGYAIDYKIAGEGDVDIRSTCIKGRI